MLYGVHHSYRYMAMAPWGRTEKVSLGWDKPSHREVPCNLYFFGPHVVCVLPWHGGSSHSTQASISLFCFPRVPGSPHLMAARGIAELGVMKKPWGRGRAQ